MVYTILAHNEVRVTRSLVLCVCFVDCCLYFSSGHYIVCSSAIYGFWIKRKKHSCHQYVILSDGYNILANFSFVDKIFK